ncbi:MAG: M23 family metallopeptidase [Bacteroidales bacterium]|nr:M23 family metallopeptidase [Bacteroidales bacterium]
MHRHKNNRHIILIIAFLIVSIGQGNSQNGNKDLFDPPLDIPLILSGNFGEIRSNHFHSGLDFKTKGQSGYSVFAAADGYITRIKVSAGGYGKALYIQHPSGHQTLYGHLSAFRKDIADYVKKQQYKQERFGVDLYFKPGQFKVKQGDFIALSGNTGSSQAPHLHFEIRDSQTHNPVNPLLFNFDVSDNRPPKLYSIYLYNLTGRTDLKKPVKVSLYGDNGSYRPVYDRVYPIDKLCGIGIEALDFLDNSNNKCGIFEFELRLDGELIFKSLMDEFSFGESLYINSFIDFRKYIESRTQVIKAFIEPNNPLSIYEFARNRGQISLTDKDIHSLEILVRDVHGNLSKTKIKVTLNPDDLEDAEYSLPYYSAFFSYSEANTFEEEGIRLEFVNRSFYDNLYFAYNSDTIPPNGYSRIHHLHNPYFPLHKSYTILIKPESLPDELKDKALIARINKNGRLSALGGTWTGKEFRAKTRSFGSFVIAVDTIPPTIKAMNLSSASPARVGKKITFRISDNFSGIKSYRATLDGNWILFEFDSKTRSFYHVTDPELFPRGKELELIVRVTDQVGHLTEYRKLVIRI